MAFEKITKIVEDKWIKGRKKNENRFSLISNIELFMVKSLIANKIPEVLLNAEKKIVHLKFKKQHRLLCENIDVKIDVDWFKLTRQKTDQQIIQKPLRKTFDENDFDPFKFCWFVFIFIAIIDIWDLDVQMA